MRRPRAGPRLRPAGPVGEAAASSAIVFQAPQASQRPDHFAWVAPQAVQTKPGVRVIGGAGARVETVAVACPDPDRRGSCGASPGTAVRSRLAEDGRGSAVTRRLQSRRACLAGATPRLPGAGRRGAIVDGQSRGRPDRPARCPKQARRSPHRLDRAVGAAVDELVEVGVGGGVHLLDGPCQRTTPPCSIATWSATVRTVVMSWVMVMAVAPISVTSSRIRSLMTPAMIGSRPAVGSSKKITSGSVAMARARPTRFCMPPESSAG